DGLARDVDQVHAAVAAGGLQRLGEDHELLAAAASQLDELRHDRSIRSAQQVDDLTSVRFEQPPLRAGDAVPRQTADRLEEARAERIVEILRLQLLGGQREIAPHIGSEIDTQLVDKSSRHDLTGNAGATALS